MTRHVWLRGLALALLLAPTVSEADAARDDFARPGLSVRAGASLGFESSDDLAEVNSLLLPTLIALGPIPGAPPGTTIEAARIEARTLAGVSLGFGYRLHPNLALEAAFDWMRGDLDLDLTISAPLFGRVSQTVNMGKWELWTVTSDLKLFALTGRLQPYALVGAGVMGQKLSDTLGAGISESQTAFVPRFGGGLDLYLTKNVLLEAEAAYLLSTGDLDGNDFITLRLGLGFRF